MQILVKNAIQRREIQLKEIEKEDDAAAWANKPALYESEMKTEASKRLITQGAEDARTEMAETDGVKI
jgi:hypothetical protein